MNTVTNVIAINTARKSNNTLAMSSREIAEYTGKEHKHVLTNIRDMAEQLRINLNDITNVYFDSRNRPQTEYMLNESLTITLVSGYSAILRHRIVEEWRKLKEEAANSFKLPKFDDPIAAAEAWIAVQKEKMEAEAQLHDRTNLCLQKTFLTLTMSQVIGSRSPAKCSAAYGWLVSNGYLKQLLKEDGKAGGYVVLEKGADYAVSTSSDNQRHKTVMFTDRVFEILPEEFIIRKRK